MYTTVSAYNESYTRQVLKDFWKKYIFRDKNNKEKEAPCIYVSEIYNALGREKNSKGEYTWSTPTSTFFDWFVSNGGFPQNYCDVDQAFDAGDYFHMPLNKTSRSDRRILLNTLGNVASFNLMKDLHELHINEISQMKCYGKRNFGDKSDLYMKVDKFVIYLPKDNVDKVLDTIGRILNTTSPRITPFCKLVKVNGCSPDLYIGIAPEIQGTSFTIERTLDMVDFLTGKRPAMFNAWEKISLTEAVKNYKQDCDDFIYNCYIFITSRIKEWWKH